MDRVGEKGGTGRGLDLDKEVGLGKYNSRA